MCEAPLHRNAAGVERGGGGAGGGVFLCARYPCTGMRREPNVEEEARRTMQDAEHGDADWRHA